MNIAVLKGGTSSERAVSLRSAANVTEALRSNGHEVETFDPSETDFDLDSISSRNSVVLPILHGAGGEDGVLQRQLELKGVPFLGSGSAACEITFDKAKYREFVTGHGIRMAAGETVTYETFQTSSLRNNPYVLKPIDGGSSVDTVILKNLEDEPSPDYLQALFARYPEMLLESYIQGQELTVGVLDDAALPVILVMPPEGKNFDYENKYNGKSEELVRPEALPIEVQLQAQSLAVKLYDITGCRHLSRSDMIVTASGEIYVLETNTMPGMTAESLFPKMAAADGITMTSLVELFVQYAIRQN